MSLSSADVRHKHLKEGADAAARSGQGGFHEFAERVHPLFTIAAITAALGISVPAPISAGNEEKRVLLANPRLVKGTLTLLVLSLAACSQTVDRPGHTMTPYDTPLEVTQVPSVTATAAATPKQQYIDLRVCSLPVDFEKVVAPGFAEGAIAARLAEIIAVRGDSYINDGNLITSWHEAMPIVDLGQGLMYQIIGEASEGNPVLPKLFLDEDASDGYVFVAMGIIGDGVETPIAVYMADVAWVQTHGDEQRVLEIMFRRSIDGRVNTGISYQCDVGDDRYVFNYNPNTETFSVMVGTIYGDGYWHKFDLDEFAFHRMLPIDLKLLSDEVSRLVGGIEFVETDPPTFPTPVIEATAVG